MADALPSMVIFQRKMFKFNINLVNNSISKTFIISFNLKWNADRKIAENRHSYTPRNLSIFFLEITIAEVEDEDALSLKREQLQMGLDLRFCWAGTNSKFKEPKLLDLFGWAIELYGNVTSIMVMGRVVGPFPYNKSQWRCHVKKGSFVIQRNNPKNNPNYEVCYNYTHELLIRSLDFFCYRISFTNYLHTIELLL